MPIRVLHVDDEAGFLRASKQILEMQGNLEIDTASSVEEAMEKMKKKTYDAIISDYIMPGKDGLQFLKELREEGSEVPFIMFTGKGREEVAIEALNLGAQRYFNKIGAPETVYSELTYGIYQIVRALRAEKALRRSEEKYKAIVELAPDSIMTFDLKGVITSCNTASTRLSGYSKDELVGKHFTRIAPIRTRDIPKFLKMLPLTLRGKVPKPFEVTFKHTDGTTRQGEVHLSLMKTEDRTTGLQAIMRDITERKKMDEALERSENKSRTLLENLPQKIFFKDENSVYLSCNDNYAQDLGVNPKEIIGKTDYDFYPKELAEKYRADDKRILTSGKTEEIEEKYIQDGKKIIVQTVKTPVKDEEGKVIGVLGIFWDITKRKMAEHEKNNLLHNLDERVKELQCLYEISKLVEERNTALDDVLKKITNLLPPAWQHSDVTCARIVHKNQEFRTMNFEKTKWRQRSNINPNGKMVGFVEVYYLEEKPTAHEGPFLKEERTLIDAVAERLGELIERKKAEEKLRGSEERYRVLVESATDAIFTLNEAGDFISVNQGAAETLGKIPEDIIGKNMYDLFPKDIADLQMRDVKAVFHTGNPILSSETLTETESGQRWYSTSLVPVRDQTGKIIYVIGFARDITERKKIEERLRESRERYKSIIKLAPDGISTMNMKGVVTSVNTAFLSLTGFSKDEIVGKHFTKLGTIRARDIPQYLKFFTAALRGNLPPIYEFVYKRKDGSIRWGEAHFSFFKKGGRKAGVQAILRDITGRKMAEKTILEAQQKFERLFMNNPEPAVYLDSKFHVSDANPRFEKFFGYSLDEIKGKHIDELVVPKDRVREAKALNKKAIEGYVYHDAVRRTKDGSLISVAISAAPINVEGKPAGYVAVYKDISKLKQTEERLQRTLVELETMNEKLGVIGKLARHDARNKLSTVTMNTFLFRQKLTDDHEALEHLDEIESACRQVEGIFNFASIYEKLGMEELFYVNVEKGFVEAVKLFPDLHGVKVVNDCHGSIVLADSLLRQLLYNLIENSLRHGEKVSQIKMHYQEIDKDKLKLIYEDDGIGIPKAEKEKIFQEGYGKGTGYGLYLIRKMCEVYNWTIQETGKEGKGAQFTIIIPKLTEEGKEHYRIH